MRAGGSHENGSTSPHVHATIETSEPVEDVRLTTGAVVGVPAKRSIARGYAGKARSAARRLEIRRRWGTREYRLSATQECSRYKRGGR